MAAEPLHSVAVAEEILLAVRLGTVPLQGGADAVPLSRCRNRLCPRQTDLGMTTRREPGHSAPPGSTTVPDGHRAFWRLERFWIVGNLLYSALRVVLAWHFLASHGLSVVGFALVEVISAVPWAIATSRLTKGLLAKNTRGLLGWAALATAAFLAPDAFVIATTHHVPAWLYVVIGAWVSIAGFVSVRRVLQAVSERGDAAGAPRTPEGSPPSQH